MTTAIFFSLGYKKGCSSFGYSKDDIYTIIEVPKEYEQEIITILNDNFCNWKDKIKYEYIEELCDSFDTILIK